MYIKGQHFRLTSTTSTSVMIIQQSCITTPWPINDYYNDLFVQRQLNLMCCYKTIATNISAYTIIFCPDYMECIGICMHTF